MPDFDEALTDRLRDHLRFDGEVVRPGLAGRLVANVSTRRRRFPRLAPSLALAVPVLVGVLLLATLLSGRQPVQAPSTNPSGTPTPVATPSEPQVTDLPPAGTQLLYYNLPGNCRVLVAVDWSGARRGQVVLGERLGLMHEKLTNCDAYEVQASPDGALIMLGITRSDSGDASVLDPRTGSIGTESDVLSIYSAPWAGDNHHVCGLHVAPQTTSSPVPSILFTLDLANPGSGLHDVGTVGEVVAQTGPVILGCSLPRDRALVAHSNVNELTSYGLYQLSTGKRLLQRAFPTAFFGTAIVSPAQDYIALGDAMRSIIRVSDGATVARLTSGEPIAFSADGALLLTATQVSVTTTRLEVIDWKSGGATLGSKWVWQKDVVGIAGSVLARPGGRDFAIAIPDPICQQYPSPPPTPCPRPATEVQLIIVHGDGTEVDIPDRAQPGW